jgi:tetratricopeptide (TPR) repeat protein
MNAINSPDLSGQDFSFADLGGKNFAGVFGDRVRFRAANLNSACLDKGDFRGADFSEASCSDLSAKRANFSQACFCGADLEGAILDGADFSGADLYQANLKLSSLEGVVFAGAKVKDADLRFCRGLTTEQKEALQSQGALVSFVWEKFKKAEVIFSAPYIFILIAAGLTGVGFGLKHHFSGLHRFSVPALREKLETAKRSGQLDIALTIDSELLERFRKQGKTNSVFNRTVDMAWIFRRMAKPEASLHLLEPLLEAYRNEPEKIVLIKVELAETHAQMGDSGRVITLLAGLDFAALDRELQSQANLTLASALRQEKRYAEAAEIGEKVLALSRHAPDLYARARSELALTFRAMGNEAKARALLSEDRK